MAVLINTSHTDIDALMLLESNLVTIYVPARTKITLADEYILLTSNSALVWENDLVGVPTLEYDKFADAILGVPWDSPQGTMVKTLDGFVMTLNDDYGTINTRGGRKLTFYRGNITDLNRAEVYADVILSASPATYNYESIAAFEGSNIPEWFTMITVLEGPTLYFLVRQEGGPWQSADGSRWRLVNVPLESILPTADEILTDQGMTIQAALDDY